MHLAIACLSVIVSLLAVAWSVRRVRTVERRLGAAEGRLSAAEWRIEAAAVAEQAHRTVYGRRLDRVERVRRVPAAELERLLWRPTPVPWRDDEEAFNPLIR